ncbi:MAG: pyridoxal phosphate-dependent aminotransferase [Gammaproteobacteria bacterium]|nr:pyridoxal phosphate-dependent aminotransferase [Gammaproteobacteria bacterium]NNL06393.1 pyridoxal phosphate-dependent aminotransferase [Gammaproteobacteria bacterium]
MDLLARARQMESEGRSVLHLEVGEPDFPTPQPIIDAGIEALRQLKTHYTPAMGLPELRQAIADYYLHRHELAIDAHRIIVTPGASGALQLALSVLVDTGDKVLLTDPGYPCNRNMIRLLGADSTVVPVSAETQYQMHASHIAEYWDEQSVAAMIASPSNPTGTMIAQQELIQLIEAVVNAGGHLIVDEIYQGLVYEGDQRTALRYSNDVFVINSFSKYFGMTGWRLGWMVVPEAYVDAVDRVAQNLFLAASTIAQHAALSAFEPGTMEILEKRVLMFRERRDYLLPVLREMGFNVAVEPAGAFYIYADCSAISQDSFAWTRSLLEDEAVALTPGIDFGEYQAATHVRFAYTRPVDQLERACSRIARYIK